jgi:hypothetical protein
MNLRTFITIQGCPVYRDIGAYIAVALEDAYPGKRRATVNSINRSVEARPILNAHGKHDQEQLYEMFLAGKGAPANRPGQSSHELRNDGVINPHIPVGAELEWWQQGFDPNDGDVAAVIAAAKKHGWELYHPYPSGSEFHHLNFRVAPKRPRVGSAMWVRIWRIRATYPKK